MAKSPKKTKTPPPKKEIETMSGSLRMHHRGFGFVVPDDLLKHPQDVFIPKHLTDNAVDGDRVEVFINPDSHSEKGPEGRIVSILSRGRTHLAGIVTEVKETTASAHAPILGATRPVLIKQTKKNGLKIGDRLILDVIEWGDQKNPTICEVSHKIGHIDDPTCDITAAVEEYELPSSFTVEAIEEAKAFGTKVTKEETKNRLDLTKTECITIDPETARDFDDALSITKDKKGHLFLGVHIADVAHYVKPGSALDKAAIMRCNSTYFPGTCIPMLPEELSNNLCSLRQGVIRLTVSVLMEFDTKGNLLHSEVKRSFIKSKKRFTYGEAKEVLDGKKKSPHLPSLKLLVELCELLKNKRRERGSLDFAMPDLVILVDEKGEPYGLKIEEYDITHQLVEECMLKANEIVAITLTDRGKTLLYRVHEEPAAENMEDFYAIARSLGFELAGKPTQEDLQALFNAARNTIYSQQLAISFIRNLKLANYSPVNVGHFGLSLEHYCHFTSPIRRYSDLITERLLFNEEGEELDLEKIALLCSEQERHSFRAESGVKLLKKLRLLKKWEDEIPDRAYSASITRIKPFGLSFEMKELFLEGFLHISELEDDYFTYEAKVPMLYGKTSGRRHVIGEEIKVRPTVIDLIHLECKWELVSTSKRRPKAPKKKKLL